MYWVFPIYITGKAGQKIVFIKIFQLIRMRFVFFP